jgi:hypothetical protein
MPLAMMRVSQHAKAGSPGAGTVGPEAMVAGSSPGTSEMAMVTMRAG